MARYDDSFLNFLKALETEGRVDVEEVQTTVADLNISYDVTGEFGGATVSEDPGECGVWHFDITLQNNNARRLVQFLKSLPNEEPDTD